jgi:tetratricopeptide (TPR) repeat protein
MADSQEQVGQRVRERRRALGLSQLELAGDDLSASYVSLIEAGKRTATGHVVELLAARLETTPDYLLEGIDVRRRDEQELRLRYAELALQNGEGDEALRHFTSLRAETPSDSKLHRASTWGMCRALEATGDLERAIAGYDEVRTRAAADPEHEERWAEAVIALCRCSREVGDLGRAIELGEQALLHLGGLGLAMSDSQVQIVSTLVGAYYVRGDLVRAQQLVSALMEAVNALPSPVARGAAYWNASLVAESRGHLGEALTLAEKALAMYAEVDSQRSYSRLKVAYAWLLLRQAEPAVARSEDLLMQARAELVETGGSVDVAYCDTELARCALLTGRSKEAVVIAGRVVESLGEYRIETGRAMLVLGQALCELGEVAEGRAQVAQASQVLQKSGGGREAAAAWSEAGDVLSQLGEHTAATDAYQRALGLLGFAPSPAPARLRSLIEN